MKNKTIVTIAVALVMSISCGFYAQAHALENPALNTDTLPSPSQEAIQQNLWEAVSADPAPDSSEIDPASQDEPESWAVVDEDGNTLNVIVCDRDYCGSGWIPTRYDGFTPVEFARVVLQGARDPQTGNSNGGHWGSYNFPSDTWTQTNPNGSVYEVPITYGSQPTCIELCPSPEPTPSPLPTSEDSGETIIEMIPAVVQERLISINPVVVNNRIVINQAIQEVIFKNRVIVFAKKGNKKKIWIHSIVGNVINIKIPIKYLSWNISFKYTVG